MPCRYGGGGDRRGGGGYGGTGGYSGGGGGGYGGAGGGDRYGSSSGGRGGYGGGGRGGGGYGGGGGGGRDGKYGDPGSKMKAIDWRSVNLPPFKKNFYDPSPAVTHRSRADVESFRTSKEITIIQVRENAKQQDNKDNIGKN